MQFNTAGPSGGHPELHANSSRVFSIDVLRGFALLGILVISIWQFGGFTSNQQAFFRTGTHGGNYKLLSIVSMLFDGKMRALFALLFGAGIILFISKKEQPTTVPVSDLYIRRMLWLMAFGILNAVILLWPGDILFQYAVLGILLFPFWRMPAKGLFIAAILTTLIYCGKQYWYYADDQQAHSKFVAVTAVEKKFAKADTVTKLKIDSLLKLQANNPFYNSLADDTLLRRYKNDTLTKLQANDKQAWENLVKGLKYDAAGDKDLFKNMRSTSYSKLWNYLLPRTKNRESWWLYRIGIWDIGSMMFFGMALFGFGFFTHYSVKKYLLIAIPCLILGLFLAWFRNHYLALKLVDYAQYIEKHSIPFDLFFPIERLLLAIAYASLIMSLLRVKFLNGLWNAAASTGRMAFSNYFLQTLLCTGFFYGYGMGYFGRLSQAKLYFVVAEFSIVQIVFSVIWLRHFTMGPVEWLWRVLIYKKRLSFRKKSTDIKLVSPQPATPSTVTA